jgi:hypothetical protein
MNDELIDLLAKAEEKYDLCCWQALLKDLETEHMLELMRKWERWEFYTKEDIEEWLEEIPKDERKEARKLDIVTQIQFFTDCKNPADILNLGNGLYAMCHPVYAE